MIHEPRLTEKWDNFETETAKEYFLKSIELSPSCDAHYNLGLCMYSLKNPKEALEHWKKSLELNANHEDALVNVGNVLAISLKRPEESLQYYERALALSPNDFQIHFNYGVVLEFCKRFELADREYRLAIEHSPENHSIRKDSQKKRDGLRSKMAQSQA